MWPLIVLLLAKCFLKFPAAPAKLLAATLVASNNQLLAAITKVAANNPMVDY
jgi:hypothetical protein